MAAAAADDNNDCTSHHSGSQTHRYELMMTMITNILVILLSTADNLMKKMMNESFQRENTNISGYKTNLFSMDCREKKEHFFLNLLHYAQGI